MAKPKGGPARWNRDYQAGRWDYLTEPREQARLAVAALYIHLFGPGAVLDIGCGSGQLFHHLDLRRIASYTGVDFSEAALAEARLDARKATLIASSAEEFTPPPNAAYDSIVFNEVIYFLAEPLAQMRRYAGFLRKGGVIVVSITRARPEGGSWDRKIHGFWTALDDGPWQTLDEVFLSHRGSGNAWRVRALRPAG